MNDQHQTFTILIAEDDSDDTVLVQRAFTEINIAYNLVSVKDGVELLNYLRHQDRFGDQASYPRPDLILLDLNMPRMDGRQALVVIKRDPDLRGIPVVVLSNSNVPEDILLTYDLGGAGFIIKPQTIDDMLDVVRVINQYWFEIVQLAGGVRANNGKAIHAAVINPAKFHY
jgi:two-component system response regulator